MLVVRPGRIGGTLLLVLASLLLGGLAHAAPARVPELPAGKAGLNIPDSLRPYVGWVLHDKEQELCPFLHGESDDRRCVWPAELSLNLSDRGGRFTQRFRIYKKDWVPLPGDGKVWPQGVTVDGKPAVVATPGDEAQSNDDSAVPQVLLNPGDHTVAGSFVWDEMPESLAVPQATGLLSLIVRGTKLPLPSRDDDGRVWLQKEATEKEEEVLELTVHRRLVDEVPPKLTTRIELRVSGKSREVLLGRTLPAGFTPLSLEGPLPARLEPDSRLRVQVRAGTFVLTMVARLDGKREKTLSIKRPSPEGTWPEDEVWVFEAQPSLRVVTVDGVPLVDPQQTTLPDDWKRLPCYPMRQGDTMQLVEQRVGDAEPAADQLSLARSLWLDFDGGGYTVSDHITGLSQRAWRLEVNPPMELGRVAVGGADQYISRLGSGGKPGVELRQSQLDISADSRLVPQKRGELPVVGWDTDFHQVQPMTLHLPPGWHLFHATGVDAVEGTWVERFNRLNVFLLVVTAIAVARLYGVLWGLLTLLMLGVALTETDAPRWAFLVVLAAEALSRLVPDGKARWAMRGGRLLALIVLSYFALQFAQRQMRSGLYPTLEQPQHFIGKEQSEEIPDWMRKRRDFDEENGQRGPRHRRAKSGSVDSANDIDHDGIPDRSDRSEVTGKLGKKEKKEMFAIKGPPGELDMKMARQQAQALASSVGIKAAVNGSMGGYKQQQNNLQQLDPNAVVQTGPGVPRWTWNVATLSFSGPVQRNQELRLWLVPPSLNSGLALLRLVLLTLLMLRLILRSDRGLKLSSTTTTATTATMFLIAGSLAMPGVARAELPPQEMLDALRERLLEPPACHPHCASSSRMVLEVQPRSLRARMEVGAAANTAVPLPGGAKQWLPERVLLDGKPAPALLRSDDGKLWLEVNEGSHQVILEGPLPSRETVQIALPLKPHRVEANVKGWRLDGLHEDGEADDDLQLSRVQGNEADAPSGLQAGTLPPFVSVVRELTFGLKWEVQTRVVRLTPTGAAVVLEVPLLPGESVTTPDVRVQAGKALVNMAPGATELRWHSLLQEKPELALQSPTGLPWTEVWRLEVAPIWHLDVAGIPPVQPRRDDSERRPEFRPWPGEQLRITLRRPDGVAGSSLTIDHSTLAITPGLRATDATLTVGMRSSRGGQHVFTLPEGAVLEELKLGDDNQPPRQEGRKVTLPLTPGAKEVMLRWRQPRGLSTVFYTPSVDLGAPSVNATLVLKVLEGRWTLWTGRAAGSGPVVAPVVLLYSYLPVLLLLSLLLARLGLTPLRAHHFMLLGLGFTQMSTQASLLFLGWLLVLGVRERYQVRNYRLFDLLQIALVVWSAVALGLLADAVHDGLLGNPEMQISGSQSNGTLLRYFLDHSSGTLPVAYVVTVPMDFYRVAMLLWALWLAFSLLRWLRWGFAAFGKGGMWKPAPPKVKPALPATKPADAPSISDSPTTVATTTTNARAASAVPESAKTPVLAAPPAGAPAHGADDEPQDKEPTFPERDTMVKPETRES